MRLIFSENSGEFLEIGDASASQKLQKLVVSVTWLCNVNEVLFLWQGDAVHGSKIAEKRRISDNAVQQLNTINSQRAHPIFV